MALSRGNNRFSSAIWPGFVDAMTTLLLVLTFVLTIFTVMQSVLRDQITHQDTTIETQAERLSRQQATITDQEARLAQLGDQVAGLAAALTTAEDRGAALQTDLTAEQARAADLDRALTDARDEARERAAQVTRLNQELDARRQTLTTKEAELARARSRLTDFEAEVAALIAAREADQTKAATDAAETRERLTDAENRASAAELAVASARAEIDAQAEQARLAAARRDALQALIADLRARSSGAEGRQGELQSQLTAAQSRAAEAETRLTEAEAARLAEAEAARVLRERLETADTELTAMTLALEESRRQAEETLTLLAAAEAARDRLATEAQHAEAGRATEAQRQAALLATARQELSQQQDLSAASQRRVALLNEQVASLTAQLASLQAVLDASGEDQRQAELRVEDLGQQLNAALLRTAEERQRRLVLEEEARTRAEAEALDLARYRSEFFGRLSQILQGRQGVEVVGDRFVFDSEVLFQPGAADLSAAGRAQIAGVVDMLADISGDIPDEIDWIIRVDGHTDNIPLSGSGRYRDNWELSQARALAVVRYMIDDLDFPETRVAAAGFADTRPVDPADTPEARARNRRIELKLTER